MEAAALLAVSSAENRMALLGTGLAGRSASGLMNRILGILNVQTFASPQGTLPDHGHLGPEQRDGMPSVFSPFSFW